jgi:hypothetical protein
MDQAGEATPNDASIERAVTGVLDVLRIGSSGLTQLYANLICRFVIALSAVGLWFYVPYMIEMKPTLYWLSELIVADATNNTHYQQMGALRSVSFKNIL